MEMWLWVLLGILTACVLALWIKVRILQNAAREIERGFADRLTTETNTLLDVSTRDCAMRSLAAAINRQLRLLRTERHRFQQGDNELKTAVTNISHDLRTPLTALCGYLDLLEHAEDAQTARRYLAIIRNRADTLVALTEELFGYSVITTAGGTPAEAVVLNDAIEEAVAGLYAAFCARGITPCVHMPDAPVTRMLDRRALDRVLANLLNNAIKYSDGDLDITLTAAGELLFANTASGLSTVEAGRLFDRFYTVETAGKSTGLGLSIAKTLVEQMRGSMSAQYENGKLLLQISLPQ